MSKHEKLHTKLARKPAPTDFTWDELVTLMVHHGFVVACSGGSHHSFQHTSGYTFFASKTHPSGLLKQYQIKAVLEALRRVSGAHAP